MPSPFIWLLIPTGVTGRVPQGVLRSSFWPSLASVVGLYMPNRVEEVRLRIDRVREKSVESDRAAVSSFDGVVASLTTPSEGL